MGDAIEQESGLGAARRLRLDPSWQVPKERHGAKVHPLRLVRTPDASRPLEDGDAAFRERVAQVLREELHGELGSRMTDAIRQLVRDELRRMATPAKD